MAAVAFGVTCLIYFLGSGRSLDYDSSITVGHFVATPSLLDPFRRAYVLNNHPFFSFTDHLVYSLGGRGEIALRALPIIFGAATVAILAWWCAKRWGVLAGAAAAMVTASNPLFAGLAREVRGYSLLALCALVSTLLFLRLSGERSRARQIAYVVTLAAGIATHLYGLLLIPLHAAIALSRRQLTRADVLSWGGAVLLGGLAYIGILSQMWAGAAVGQRAFTSGFALDLTRDLLGTHLPAVISTAVLVVGALVASWPPKRTAVSLLAVLVALIAGIWLVAQPHFLFPRFFAWLVPAIGFLAARAVARWPLAIALAVICVASTVLYDGASWTEDPLPTREAAHILSAAAARGLQPCVLGFYGESLVAYSPPRLNQVTSAPQLAGCDVALEYNGIGPVSQARAILPYQTILRGQSSFYIYSRRPIQTIVPNNQDPRR